MTNNKPIGKEKIKFEMKVVDRKDIRDFIEKWHYSKSINGIMSSYCFGLYDEDKLIGAMIYGKLGMANAWKKYASLESDVIELRRLCCIDDTPKNTESYFIGKTLKWLEKNTHIKTIVSYADTNYGHTGIIYQATNFMMVGQTAKGKVIFWKGKKYHDKAIRTKYKGQLKPFAKKLKEALNKNEAHYEITQPKNIYVKDL
jgi:hypothetical protein